MFPWQLSHYFFRVNIDYQIHLITFMRHNVVIIGLTFFIESALSLFFLQNSILSSV